MGGGSLELEHPTIVLQICYDCMWTFMAFSVPVKEGYFVGKHKVFHEAECPPCIFA